MPYAGIDLGATNLQAQVTDATGSVLGTDTQQTPGDGGGAIEDRVRACLGAACDDAGIAPAALAGVGIGAFGPLDQSAGAIVAPPNVPADRIEVVAAVEDLVDCPVILENDAVAGAHGEQAFADAPANAVYLTLSTGVGAGAIVDGRVLQGTGGNAAEIGHVVVQPDGRPCGCGGRGHWEAYCSGRAIPGVAMDLHERGITTDLDVDDLAAADVFAAAGEDPLADAVIDRVGTYNTIGVAAIVHAYAPEVISIGGAVARHNESLVLDPIRERLADHLAIPAPTVRITPLGDRAVLRGAVAIAHQTPGR